MRVAVLRGGRSSEHDVSLRSGAAVGEGLRQAGHEVLDVVIAREGGWSHEGKPVTIEPAAGLLGCAVAFPVLHGPGGEDGSVQGALEVADVPYVGSDVEASALCLDKLAFKRVLAAEGIPQVDFLDATVGAAFASSPDGWREPAEALGLPLWVKPARLGSSVGITKVESLDELARAVRRARRHDPKVIVEASGPGAEVECSVLGHSEPAASVPGEIIAHADWYDFEAKYEAGGMDLRVPAGISATATERVRELALRVFALCGCSGLGRCDFFVDGETVLVNELNTIPGFTETSVYGKLWEATGIPYPDLCDRLLSFAVEKHTEARSFKF